MNLFKNHTTIVLSACIGAVVVEEWYQTLSLDVRTAVTAKNRVLLACSTASSSNFLLTSVKNYHYTPHDNPEERSSHLLHGRVV